MNSVKLAVIALLAAFVLIFAACGRGTAGSPTPDQFATSPPESLKVVKPLPVVGTVTAATTGMFDNYYAIVEATVKNNGADGMVIVAGSITQGANTVKAELPTYITRNTTQTVKLVFPLKWKGGDWTPDVQAVLP